MRILIVEDEQNALTVMGSLLSKAFPEHQVVMEASAVSALKQFDLSPFDVILTDIQMPEMDGLQFIETIRAAGSECPIIVISAYDQFYYAQRALQQRAFNYILKPFDRNTLLDTVQRALTLASQQAAASSSELSFSDFCAQYPFVQVFIIFEERQSDYGVERTQEEWQGLKNTLNALPDVLFNAIDHPMAFLKHGFDSSTSLIWVFGAENPDPFASATAALPGNLRVQETSYRCHLRLSAGSVVRGHEADRSVREAEIAQSFSFYYPLSPVLRFRPFETRMDDLISVKKLDRAIQEGQEALSFCLREAVTTAASRVVLPERFRAAMDEHFAEIVKTRFNGLSTAARIRFEEARKRLLACATAERWIAEAAALLAQTEDALSKSRDNRNADAIEACLEYINTHYMDPNLTLKEIADEFHFNQTYFSSLFKKQMGVTIVQYLTDVRMRAAKNLILNTDIRLADVAARTGYNDLHYFMRVFKQNVGMTPSSYKKRGGRS